MFCKISHADEWSFKSCKKWPKIHKNRVTKSTDFINKYLCHTVLTQILFTRTHTEYLNFLPAATLVVVSHVGGLIFSVCVMLQRGLGFREVVTLQVPENHLDLVHVHTHTHAHTHTHHISYGNIKRIFLCVYSSQYYTSYESSVSKIHTSEYFHIKDIYFKLSNILLRIFQHS